MPDTTRNPAATDPAAPTPAPTPPAEGVAHGSLLVICLTYAVAAIVFNVAPTYILTLMDGYSLSETMSGLVATVDMLAMAVTAFVAGPALMRLSRRRLLAAGAAVVIIGNALSLVSVSLTDSAWPLLTTRLIAGVGTGLLLVFANTMAATTSNPTRSYGLATVTATLVGAVMFVVLPPLIDGVGPESLFVALLILGLLVLLFVPWEPRTRLTVEAHETSTDRLPLWLLQWLSFALMAMMVVQSAYYAFAQQAAEDAGMSTGAAGAALSVGYLCGILTSALAAWLHNRLGRWKPIAVSMALQAAASVVVMIGGDSATVAVALVAQSAALFFGIPYLLSLNAEADTSGQYSNIGVGLFFFSLAIGPFLGGLLLHAFGNAGIVVAVVLGTAAGLVALIPVTRALAARPPAEVYDDPHHTGLL